jgi:Putative prokaryotic signal transducing protein
MARIKGWAVVFKGPQWQADVIAASLAAQGIEAESFQEMRIGPIIDAQVLVPQGQASRARRIIEEAETAPVPPDEEDV